jgi:hypothetical protein
MIQQNFSVSYETKKQRDDAFDDIVAQQEKAFAAVKASSIEGDQLTVKQKAEWDALYVKHFGGIMDRNSHN